MPSRSELQGKMMEVVARDRMTMLRGGGVASSVGGVLPPADISIQAEQHRIHDLQRLQQEFERARIEQERANMRYPAPHPIPPGVMVEEAPDKMPVPSEPLDEAELQAGTAKELRRVKTPAMGQKFDMARMTVDSVLVLNRLVQEIESLHEKLDALLAEKEAAANVTSEPISLPSLSASYEDVKKK